MRIPHFHATAQHKPEALSPSITIDDRREPLFSNTAESVRFIWRTCTVCALHLCTSRRPQVPASRFPIQHIQRPTLGPISSCSASGRSCGSPESKGY